MQGNFDQYPESYAAFFAPRTHKFETVDFRIAATPHNIRTYFPKNEHQRQNRARIAGLLGLTVGVIFAIIVFCVDQLTRGLAIGLYKLTAAGFARGFWAGLIAYVAMCMVYAMIPAASVVYFAPLGAGSGLPELKAYLNGVRIPGFLSFRTLVVKAIGIAFSIASGLICGKQGPMIHGGAIVGAAVSQAASATFRWRLRASFLHFFRTEAWKRDFTAVGAAVGIAAAFGSPMGAWMWVYEEACTYWSWELGIITLIGCLAGSIIARMLNFFAAGLPDGGFGTFTLTQFGKLVTPFNGTSFPIKDMPAFVLIGVLGGVTGAIFPLVSKTITLFRYKRVTKPVARLCEAALITFLTAAVRFLVPYFADDCRPVDESFSEILRNAPLSNFSQFNCADGQFSPWAAVFYNPADSVVRGLLFHTDSAVFLARPVAAALGFYFVFIILTYGIAIPAGVFFPAFLLGSVYGRLFGIAVKAVFPLREDISLTGYAFVGAVSALAGFTRTISVSVIALEATGGNDASFAAVLVALVAKLVGDFFYKRGIYDLHVDLKGMPFLKNEIQRLELYSQVRVCEVMENCVVGVRRRSRVRELLNMLRTNAHHAFPVFIKVEGGLDNVSSGTGTGVNEVLEMQSSKGSEADDAQDMDLGVVEDDENYGDEPSTLLMASPHPSSIITPTVLGMQATIFDEGRKRVMWLPGHSEQWTSSYVQDDEREMMDEQLGTLGQDKSLRETEPEQHQVRMDETEASNVGILDYQLIGMVDRSTLLVLLKNECDKRQSTTGDVLARTSLPKISRDKLDAAWPNPLRMKGDTERELIEQVKMMDNLDVIIDLKEFIDPDPVLISDRAHCMSAYTLFRRTGARHILVANMRSGHVCGIITRKDILEESVSEVLEKRSNMTLSEVRVD